MTGNNGKHNFFARKSVIIICIVSGSLMLLFANPSPLFSPIKSVLESFFSPLQKATFLTAFTVREWGGFIGSIGSLKEQNATLLTENQRLKADLALFDDVRKENEQLRTEIGLRPRELTTTGAEIIGLDPQGQGNWIQINKGEKDGIPFNAPIISASGAYIGNVQERERHTARVSLVTDSENVVHSVVAGTNTQGLVRGEYGLSAVFDLILQTENLSQGSHVITSGVGGDVPRGLLIGSIGDITESSDGLFQKARLKLPINITQERFLYVVLPQQ